MCIYDSDLVFKLNYKRNENYYSTITTTTTKNMELWQNMEDRMQHAMCFTFSKKKSIWKICTSKQTNGNNNVYMYHYHHHCGGFGTFKGLSDTRGIVNFVILLRVNSPDIKPAAVCLNRLGTCGGGLR